MKKQQLNQRLYHLHLLLANSWDYILHTINKKLDKLTQPRYKSLEAKQRKLSQDQITSPPTNHTFFPRVVNNTKITFSDTELKLLEKGTKYNLHYKQKNWLTNVALEAKSAISLLPVADREFYKKQVSDPLLKLGSQDKTSPNPHHLSELETIRSIRTKLQDNDAVMTTADNKISSTRTNLKPPP
jgi:hypothetical protein